MGNDNNQDSKNGLISILLLIMLVTGTAINNPLTSSRPYDSQNSKLISPEAHQVDARLWQDPIVAVDRHTNHLKNSGKDPEKIAYSFKDFLAKEKSDNKENIYTDLRVIAISVFGSSYSELVEFRQRYRYAVISALGSSDYFPQDNEHLQFFLHNTHLANNCEVYVPYEWFERDINSNSGKKERVLILWLNEEKIISTQYGSFVSTLFDQFREVPSQNFSFTLIGPTNTSKFVELMKSTEIDRLPASFKIISSSATISDDDLFNAYKQENQCNQSNEGEKRSCIKKEIADKLAEKSIIRTIGQDVNLAKALVWELRQRGVNRKNSFIKDKCEDGLIVISEQDSLYARALTQHFIDSVDTYCKKKKNEKSPVTQFTYLRGLDGKLPDLDESSRKSQNTQDKKEQKNLIAQLDDASPEHAEGRNQFDYLRRLIDKIDKLDRGEGLGVNRIKAIGIFGNDVYDKLLILQALRNRFKHRIFFTTELDARYLHADQTRWARNLVVASNFDFTLHLELQRTTMPFRDSYQTSMYLATLLTLNFPTIEIAKSARPKTYNQQKQQKQQKIQEIQQIQNELDKLLNPQIFEIGRTQAVHLATPHLQDTSNESNACGIEEILSCSSLEQNRKKEIDIKTVSQLFLLIVVIFFLSYFLFKPYVEGFVTLKNSLICIAIISFILFFYYWDNFPYHKYGEPFFWFEGVSVWPNLVIRYLGIIFILLFSFNYYIRLRKDMEIIDELKLPKPQEPKDDGHGRETSSFGPFSGFTSTGKDVNALWREYLLITDLIKSKGYLWILCVAAISLGLTYFGIFSLGYLNFPSRGEITQNLHNILAFVQFSILWGLIYWVGYEATVCRRFIDQLGPKESADQLDWPLELMEEYEKRTGISREELKPYFRFLLITRLIKRVNSIIYMPFVLMLLIAIGRSNVFDNLGFSPALIIVFIGASIYLIITLIFLKKSAEKQCEDILQYYEEDRPGRISLAFGNANTVDQVVTEIRNKKQQIFSFFQQPSLLALLLPGGGIGLTSIIEYLYN
jgi:hypothetical protein